MSPVGARSVDAAQVPDVGDPERKRMLNVLAQRRYRKRKRDRMAALEAQVKKTSRDGSTKSPDGNIEESPRSETISSTIASSTSPEDIDQPPETEERQFAFSASDIITTAVDWSLMPAVDSGPVFDVTEIFNQLNNASFDFDTFSDSQTTTRALPMASAPPTTGASPRMSNFADDALIDIPILKVHQAGLELASLLGCVHQMFDPSVSRVMLPIADPRAPAWLQPTLAQQTIPHHPFIDILPWPSVRTRLLIAFSQPAHLRPPAAQDDNGLLRLMSDTDSEVEGCRVNGDGFQADDWEIGQSFFTNWWWALDPRIVEISNERRLKRGDRRLQLTSS